MKDHSGRNFRHKASFSHCSLTHQPTMAYNNIHTILITFVSWIKINHRACGHTPTFMAWWPRWLEGYWYFLRSNCTSVDSRSQCWATTTYHSTSKHHRQALVSCPAETSRLESYLFTACLTPNNKPACMLDEQYCTCLSLCILVHLCASQP